MSSAAPKTALFSLYTWNSQGNPATLKDASSKRTVLNYFATTVPATPTIVFLQEGGGVYKGKSDGYAFQAEGPGVGGFNPRCTMYVLIGLPTAAAAGGGVKLPAPKQEIIADAGDRAVVGGGMAGRAPAAIGLGPTLFISWHSTASGDSSDTATLLKALQGNPRYRKDYRAIVIGGDFNAAPEALEKMVAQKENLGPYQAAVLKCGKATHLNAAKDKRSELDFFIVLDQAGAMKAANGPDLVETPPSDHYAVAAQLLLPI